MNLHTEPWSWTLDRMPEGLVLVVVCGSVGIFDRTIVLSPEEAAAFERGGPAALEPLVEEIRNDVTGARFGDRYRRDLDPWGNQT